MFTFQKDGSWALGKNKKQKNPFWSIVLAEAFKVYIHIKGSEKGFTNTNFLKECSKKKEEEDWSGECLSLLTTGEIQFLTFH